MIKWIVKMLAYPIHSFLFSYFLFDLLAPVEAKQNGFKKATPEKKYKYKHVNFNYIKGERLYLQGERLTLKLEKDTDPDRLTIYLFSKKYRSIWKHPESFIELDRKQLKDTAKFLEDNFKIKTIPVKGDEHIFLCGCRDLLDTLAVYTSTDDWEFFEIAGLLNKNQAVTLIREGDENRLYSIIKNYLDKTGSKIKKED